MRTSLLVLLLLLPQDAPEALVRRLGSDSPAERDAAERALRDLGAPALPALDAASKDADGEVAVRAGRIARAIRLLADAPPALLRRFPQAAERVAGGGDAAWVALALDIARADGAADADDRVLLRYLLPRALRANVPPEELRQVLEAAERCLVEDALPDAVRLLAHPDEEVREAASDLLRELENPRAVQPLLELLRGSEPGIRETAALLIAQIRHPDAVAVCIGLLRDPWPEVREAALSGLRGCPGPGPREAVESCLGDRAAEVREAAARTLASLRHPSSIPRFKALLADPEGDVREAALDGLARLRAPGSEPSILPLLADPEPEVRESALGALISLGSPAAGRELIRRVADGELADIDRCLRWLSRFPHPEAAPAILERLKTADPNDVERAGEVLARDAKPAMLPSLRAIAADEKDPRRPLALDLLARLGGPAPDAALLRALRDSAAPIRLRAIRALSASGHPPRSEDVLPLLGDVDAQVRRAAVWALRELPLERRLPRLLHALQDADSEVVEAAIDVLGDSAAPEQRAALWAVVDGAHEDDTRRRAMRTALQLSGPGDAAALSARIADPEFGPSVFEMLPELGAEDGIVEEAFSVLERAKPEHRGRLLQSLSHYDLPGLAERLTPFLKSAAPGERAAAAEAVARLRAWSRVPELAALLDDPALEVRRAAFSALNALDAEALYPAARKIAAAGDPPELRAEAISVLSEDPSPETRETLRKLLDHPIPWVSAGALESLALLGDEGLRPRLLERLRRGSNSARREAMGALAGLPGPGGADLLPWMEDPLEDVRRQAVRSTGRSGDRAAAPRLLRALEDPEDEVVREALEALGALGVPEAATAAAERLHARDPELRLAAARTLRRADPARGRAATLELLEDPDAELRRSALRDAAESGDEVLRDRVAGFLRDPEDATRRSAIYYVGLHRIRSAATELIRAAEGGNPHDRANAVHSLGSLGDPAAPPALRRALAATSLHWSRRSVAYALALCGDPAGVPLLMRGRASFLTLNAVRRPEQWRRLHDLDVRAPLGGGLAADLRTLADAAGLELEVSAEAAKARIRRPRGRFDVSPLWWTEALVRACSWDVVPVIEERTLRVLSRAEARAFFRGWWESESKRAEAR